MALHATQAQVNAHVSSNANQAVTIQALVMKPAKTLNAKAQTNNAKKVNASTCARESPVKKKMNTARWASVYFGMKTKTICTTSTKPQSNKARIAANIVTATLYLAEATVSAIVLSVINARPNAQMIRNASMTKIITISAVPMAVVRQIRL